MEKVVIFGNSLYAELYHFCLTHDSPCEVAAFTVDREYITDTSLFGLPVVPFDEVERLFPPAAYSMIVSVSFQKVNSVRERKYREAREKGYRLIRYVSSRAVTWPNLEIGDNCVIGAHCTVEPFVTIGNNVTVTTSVTVGHHVTVGDNVFIAPGAILLGGVTVGDNSLIGANATIKEGVTIGRECIIGTGVSITSNTVERGVYVNRPPELSPRRSNELREWLAWPSDPLKPRWGSGARRRQHGAVPDQAHREAVQ